MNCEKCYHISLCEGLTKIVQAHPMAKHLSCDLFTPFLEKVEESQWCQNCIYKDICKFEEITSKNKWKCGFYKTTFPTSDTQNPIILIERVARREAQQVFAEEIKKVGVRDVGSVQFLVYRK